MSGAQKRYILRRQSRYARTPSEVGAALAKRGDIRILDEGPEYLLITMPPGHNDVGQSPVLDGWVVVAEQRYSRPDHPERPQYPPDSNPIRRQVR